VLSLQTISVENAKRAKHWHGGKVWTVMEWACAMGGEAGEAQNIAKKIRRAQQGINNRMAGTPDDQIVALIPELVEECADTFLYLLLLLDHVGVDGDAFEEAVVEKFNRVSEEMHFPERLSNLTDPPREEPAVA